MRKFLATILAVFLFSYLFRGPIYRSVVKYRVTDERTALSFNGEARSLCLANLRESTLPMDMEGAVDFALDLTAGKLSYAFRGTSNDPSILLLSNDRAHCVGYAALFSAACNVALDRSGLQRTVRCEQKVAKLEVFGEDIHALFDSPFFKDHDICLVTDLRSGAIIAVDPTLNDFLGVDRVALVR